MKKIILVDTSWSKEDMEMLRKQMENNEVVIVGGELKVFAIKDNELFEVVNDLKFVKKLEVEE